MDGPWMETKYYYVPSILMNIVTCPWTVSVCIRHFSTASFRRSRAPIEIPLTSIRKVGGASDFNCFPSAHEDWRPLQSYAAWPSNQQCIHQSRSDYRAQISAQAGIWNPFLFDWQQSTLPTRLLGTSSTFHLHVNVTKQLHRIQSSWTQCPLPNYTT